MNRITPEEFTVVTRKTDPVHDVVWDLDIDLRSLQGLMQNPDHVKRLKHFAPWLRTIVDNLNETTMKLTDGLGD